MIRRVGKWALWAVAGFVALIVALTLIVAATSGDTETQTVVQSTSETQTVEADPATVTVEINPTAKQKQQLRDERQKLDARAALLDAREATIRAREKAVKRAEGLARRSTFSDGTYLVGEEITPGTYRSANGNGDCYWARLRDLSGGLNSILANANPSGPTIVAISSSDKAFESARCGTWQKIG